MPRRFVRDIVSGLFGPRGLLLLASFAAAGVLVGLWTDGQERIVALAALALVALPTLLVWGAFIGLARRLDMGDRLNAELHDRVGRLDARAGTLEQARHDIGWALQGLHEHGTAQEDSARHAGWALQGLHERSERHEADLQLVQRWCRELADRLSHLETVASELQSGYGIVSGNTETLRTTMVELAQFARGLEERLALAPLTDRPDPSLAGRVAHLETVATELDRTLRADGSDLSVIDLGAALRKADAAILALGGRVSLVEDGLLAQAATVEAALRGRDGAPAP